MPNLVCETPAARRSDDTWLGVVLTATWALRTGRILRNDVPVEALTDDELITFWADPLLDEACLGTGQGLAALMRNEVSDIIRT
jgi:hypothetical protein